MELTPSENNSRNAEHELDIVNVEAETDLGSLQVTEPDIAPISPPKLKASGWAEYAAAKPREDNPTGPRFDEDGNRVGYPHHLT